MQPERGSPGTDRLAVMLRELRSSAGLSGRQLAKLTHMSQTKVSRIESREIVPSIVDVEIIIRALRLDEDTAAVLSGLAKRANSEHRSIRLFGRAGWKHKQRELQHLEQASRCIHYFLPAMLTGLLQTPEYARASVESPIPTVRNPSEIAQKKIERQAVLDQEDTRFNFILTHSAVTWPVLAPAAMVRQYEHLIELSLRPNVSIRVLRSKGNVLGEAPLNTFVVYDQRLVGAEVFSGEIVLTDPRDIAYHLSLFHFFESNALSEAETRSLLAECAATATATGVSP